MPSPTSQLTPAGASRRLTRTLPGFTTAISTSKPRGGWDKLKSAADYEQMIKDGKFLEMWQWRSGESARSGTVAQARLLKSATDKDFAEGKLKDGVWTVVFKRPLAGGPGRHELVPGKTYNIGFAIHDDYANWRYHNVYEIYELNLASGLTTQLTDKLGVCIAPEISPDGRSIVFTWGNAKGASQIWVMERSGANPHKIHPQGWDPTWSPDGTQILFASNMEGANQLFVMDANGANQRCLSMTYVYPGAEIAGTRYARLGLNEIDVQMAHGILAGVAALLVGQAEAARLPAADAAQPGAHRRARQSAAATVAGRRGGARRAHGEPPARLGHTRPSGPTSFLVSEIVRVPVPGAAAPRASAPNGT